MKGWRKVLFQYPFVLNIWSPSMEKVGLHAAPQVMKNENISAKIYLHITLHTNFIIILGDILTHRQFCLPHPPFFQINSLPAYPSEPIPNPSSPKSVDTRNPSSPLLSTPGLSRIVQRKRVLSLHFFSREWLRPLHDPIFSHQCVPPHPFYFLLFFPLS